MVTLLRGVWLRVLGCCSYKEAWRRGYFTIEGQEQVDTVEPFSHRHFRGLFYTVHSESIQTPSIFPHFVKLQPYSKMD